MNNEKMTTSYSFLTIGKTQESTETQEYKRYIGVGSTRVLAVNPNKAELDKLMGYESANAPEYVVDGENGKEAHIVFIVRTDPSQCNGIEITNRLSFILRNAPAYNRDQTKVQVLDDYGNSTWAPVEDAKAHKKLLSAEGKPLKIDDNYRMACVGEADLVGFLKTYLCVQDVFNYINGVWTKKENASDYMFGLEHVKDYFNGNFSEIKEALKLQPGNKVKLLYGVRTTDENKQYQTIAKRSEMILPNNAGNSSYLRLEKNLASAKAAGAFSNTEFKVQELQEYSVEPTNLDTPSETSSSNDEMPWD